MAGETVYIRFVVGELDGESGRRQGLFQAAAALRDAGALQPWEEERFNLLWAWFREHLEKPESFSRSRRSDAARRALSWFKPTASEHISRMYQMASILDAHGVLVTVIRCARPGYVVYEDEVQVTAEPFAETGA